MIIMIKILSSVRLIISLDILSISLSYILSKKSESLKQVVSKKLILYNNKVATHFMNLDPIYYEEIKNNKKIYEIRLNDDKRQKIKVGDLIVFNNTISKKVISKDIFDDFKGALSTYPLAEILPGINSIEEAIEIYHNISKYKENEDKYGVVVFKLY